MRQNKELSTEGEKHGKLKTRVIKAGRKGFSENKKEPFGYR